MNKHNASIMAKKKNSKNFLNLDTDDLFLSVLNHQQNYGKV